MGLGLVSPLWGWWGSVVRAFCSYPCESVDRWDTYRPTCTRTICMAPEPSVVLRVVCMVLVCCRYTKAWRALDDAEAANGKQLLTPEQREWVFGGTIASLFPGGWS